MPHLASVEEDNADSDSHSRSAGFVVVEGAFRIRRAMRGPLCRCMRRTRIGLRPLHRRRVADTGALASFPPSEPRRALTCADP